MKLHSYQITDVKKIKEEWKNHSSILYQLPTGGGKTVIINDIIESILDKKILILVHRQEIIFQIRDRLKQKGITAGVLIGNFEENIDADILVGSIQTVARDARLQNILDRNFNYIIIDEAHHACSDNYIKTISSFKIHNPNYKLLGVTATPYRKDNKKLNKIFDILILGPTYSQLRKDRFLSNYTCYAAKLEGLSNVETSGGDFKLSDLSKFMRKQSLIDRAIDMYRVKGECRQMLVFCVDKKHALQVKASYIKAGFTKIENIDSDTPDNERKRINQDYRDKKIDIIVSVQTLTEGVDLPETGVIQCLRPTLSIVLYLQILGRGTRIKSDGSKLIILDLSHNSYEHGLLDSNFIWNLNNNDPNPNKKINKIIGKRKGGGITIDEDEIDSDYLELEEMSHQDYLSQNVDGIQLAEKENKEKDELMTKLYLGLITQLNSKCKIPQLTFSNNIANLINYDNWKEIKINYNDKELCEIKFYDGKIKIYLGWDSTLEYKDYYRAIIKGKLVEYIQKEYNQNILKNTWNSIQDLYKSKINIKELQNKVEDIEKEKCIFKIDQLLEQGKFIFKLHTEGFTSDLSSRNGWGRFDEITFVDNPKRLKVNNNIKVNNVSGYNNGQYPNLNKDTLVKILYNNWYKNKK